MESSIVVKGCIQIWDVGVIFMETMTQSAPHLLLTIGHEFGVVREMKWCPSGCYEGVRREREGEEGGVRERGRGGVEKSEGEGEEMEEEGDREEVTSEMEEETVGTRSEGGEEGEEERLSRLGLLAVATSDGYARILRYD